MSGNSVDNGGCCPPQSTSQPSKTKVPHPPAEAAGYEYKGRFESVGDFDNVYVTGARGAKVAIVTVYDIFGFWETTLQGQDILASKLPVQVFVPDLFRGKPFPKDKDGDKEELKKFFSGTAKLDDRLPEVIRFARSLRNTYGFERVHLVGYCWGGKLVLLALAQSSPFNSGAVVHPAMITPEDGNNLSVPLGFYPSADEPKDVVADIQSAMARKPFAAECDYHLYDTVHHGWAAARADLKDPENLKQYNDVYQRLASYFQK